MTLSSTVAGAYDFTIKDLSLSIDGGTGAGKWNLLDLSDQALISEARGDTLVWHENFVLAVPSLTAAGAFLPILTMAGKAHAFYLLIKNADGKNRRRPPQTIPQLTGGMAPAAVPAPAGYTALRISGGKWVDVHRAAAAALILSRGGRGGAVLEGIRVGIRDPRYAPWAAGDPLARAITDELIHPEDDDIFPVDIVVSQETLTFPGKRRPAGVLDPSKGYNDYSGWSSALPPVDVRSVSPGGFLPLAKRGIVTTYVLNDGTITFQSDETGAVVTSLGPGEAVGEQTIGALRKFTYADLESLMGDANYASLVSSLAVAGVPILRAANGPVQRLLGANLAAAIRRFDEGDQPYMRESKSIDMRRLALGLFEPSSRWGFWASQYGKRRDPVAVSVVLATRRPEQLEFALSQIAQQTWTNIEVVAVLHGFELAPAKLDALKTSFGRPITVCQAPADAPLGDVLNIGTGAASGQLITKMDDDDWYAPNHILDLVNARVYSGAELVGNQVEFVYLEDIDIVTRRPPQGERFSDHVAGGTMLISKADLVSLGGWRSVHRAVDRCLLQAVEAAGASTYRSHGQNYVMHRYASEAAHGGHTWVPKKETFLQNASEQWDGFVLPPQFQGTNVNYAPPGRAADYRSVFGGAVPDAVD